MRQNQHTHTQNKIIIADYYQWKQSEIKPKIKQPVHLFTFDYNVIANAKIRTPTTGACVCVCVSKIKVH